MTSFPLLFLIDVGSVSDYLLSEINKQTVVHSFNQVEKEKHLKCVVRVCVEEEGEIELTHMFAAAAVPLLLWEHQSSCTYLDAINAA